MEPGSAVLGTVLLGTGALLGWLLEGSRAPAVAGIAVVFALLYYAAGLIHEAAHALAAACVGRRTSALIFRASGFAVRIEGAPDGSRADSIGAHALISLAGPLASLALGVAMLRAGGHVVLAARAAELVSDPGDVFALLVAFVGLATIVDGLVNLLPLSPRTDGGRLVEQIRARRRPPLPHTA